MIIDDPAPTLYSNQCRYVPSNSIQDFIEKCLDKDPQTRLSVSDALNHPFLKRAAGPSLLQKYLSRRPELDKRSYLMSRSTTKKKHEEDEDDDDDDSWDELDFLETTWDFNEENTPILTATASKPPPVHTKHLDRRVHSSSGSPITPNDGEQIEGYLDTNYYSKKKKNTTAEQEFLMTKEYYY
jgi:serine/threonine protein kinase